MRLLLLLALVLAPATLPAQEFDFYTRGPYRTQVPRPESILGYPVGTHQTMYYQQQEVLDRMAAAAPDRVRIEPIGNTVEGRPMRMLIISSAENLARLDQIRADLARLADPRKTSAAEAATIAQRTPVTVLLNHAVHGNEPAGFEAAMQTAYQLLASDEPATLAILKNCVVLINPSENPDGHDRFAAWYNSVAVGSDEPAAVEQSEPWAIWGRFNHYRFDMNRDQLAQSQPESQAIGRVFMRWRPQVIVDLHSTTSQYFFPPVSQAFNQNLPPATYRWFERFGKQNGAAFDARGWQYYVRDVFDFFYPGYLDIWPTLHGGVGMTFESDGGPELKKRKDDGSYITLEMGIAHNVVASMATLATASDSREDRLKDYYDFHVTGMAEAKGRAMKRVVFLPSPNPDLAVWLARRLVREGIEVTRATKPFSVLKATSYLGGAQAKRTFPEGSYVVDLSQPEARLATTILEPKAVFDSGFVRRELAKYQRNQIRGSEAETEGYDFYDITAWSLPLAMGLDAWWTEDTPPVTGEAVPDSATTAPPAAPPHAQSAYVFGNERTSGVMLASRLLNEGFRLSVATQSITADGKAYPRGTFVVRTQRNPGTVHDRIAALARDVGAQVTAVQSAFPDTGGFGIGSESVVGVNRPRVLIAAGDGISQTEFGAVWFYLEREVGMPVVPVNLSSIGDMKLSDYNVLIIPSGSPGRMWHELQAGGAEALKSWVNSGAAVVAIGNAATLLGRKEIGLSSLEEVGAGDSTKAKGDSTKRDTLITPDARPAPPLVSPSAPAGARPEFIPGAIFRATLDRTHWLTFGYERDQLPVFLESDRLFKPSAKGANPVVFVGKDLTLAGFTWPDNTERLLRNSVWATVESAGSGRVITFAENPVYRGFWRGTALLFTNAILFGPTR
jgi:zinc carboxypeptidase